MTVNGVGTVSAGNLACIEEDAIATARAQAETMAAIWGAIAATTNPDRRSELIERYGAMLVKAGNHHQVLLQKLGLHGPYDA